MPVTVPAATGKLTVSAVDAGGETDTLSIAGLAQTKLDVDLTKSKVAKGGKIVVKVSGLAQGETVTVRWASRRSKRWRTPPARSRSSSPRPRSARARSRPSAPSATARARRPSPSPNDPLSTAAAARLAAAVLVIAAAGLAGAVTASPASAATCGTGSGVSLVVDFGGLGGGVQTACVANGAGKSASSLFDGAGFELSYVQNEPGFVCRIDDRPSSSVEACVNTPPDNAYWGLWWSDGTSGDWVYSNYGVGTLKVPDGAYVGWAWQTAASPRPARRRPPTRPRRRCRPPPPRPRRRPVPAGPAAAGMAVVRAVATAATVAGDRRGSRLLLAQLPTQLVIAVSHGRRDADDRPVRQPVGLADQGRARRQAADAQRDPHPVEQPR